MNCFNKDKHPCAICGQCGHSFDGCTKLKNTNVKQAYIHLLLCFNCFVKGFNKLNLGKQTQDLRTIKNLTLSKLDALEKVDLTSLSSSLFFLIFYLGSYSTNF